MSSLQAPQSPSKGVTDQINNMDLNAPSTPVSSVTNMKIDSPYPVDTPGLAEKIKKILEEKPINKRLSTGEERALNEYGDIKSRVTKRKITVGEEESTILKGELEADASLLFDRACSHKKPKKNESDTPQQANQRALNALSQSTWMTTAANRIYEMQSHLDSPIRAPKPVKAEHLTNGSSSKGKSTGLHVLPVDDELDTNDRRVSPAGVVSTFWSADNSSGKYSSFFPRGITSSNVVELLSSGVKTHYQRPAKECADLLQVALPSNSSSDKGNTIFVEARTTQKNKMVYSTAYPLFALILREELENSSSIQLTKDFPGAPAVHKSPNELRGYAISTLNSYLTDPREQNRTPVRYINSKTGNALIEAARGLNVGVDSGILVEMSQRDLELANFSKKRIQAMWNSALEEAKRG